MFYEQLYKIKPIDIRNIKNIRNDEIWIPEASSLNDPYDCSNIIDNDTNFKEEELNKLIGELENICPLFADVRDSQYYDAKSKKDKNAIVFKNISSIINKIGVCSFVDTPYNILTWSHYGDGHKGMCLEFTNNESKPNKKYQSYIDGFKDLPVSYSNNMPICNWEDFLRAPMFVLNILFTTKYKDWSYENEVRILTYNGVGGRCFPYSTLGLKLSKIYLGINVEDNCRLKALKSICKDKQIEIVELEKNNTNFKLQNKL